MGSKYNSSDIDALESSVSPSSSGKLQVETNENIHSFSSFKNHENDDHEDKSPVRFPLKEPSSPFLEMDCGRIEYGNELSLAEKRIENKELLFHVNPGSKVKETGIPLLKGEEGNGVHNELLTPSLKRHKNHKGSANDMKDSASSSSSVSGLIKNLKIKVPRQPLLIRERSVSFGSASVLGDNQTVSPSVDTLTALSDCVRLNSAVDDDVLIASPEEKERHLRINDALEKKDMAKIEKLLSVAIGTLPHSSFYTPVLVTACCLCSGKTIDFGILAIKTLLASLKSDPQEKESTSKARIINASDPENGFTCLHWAAALGCEKVLQLLLDAGSFPNVQCLKGETPLHRASRYGHCGTISFLLNDFKADPTIRNCKGELAIDIAALAFKQSSGKFKLTRAKVMKTFFRYSSQSKTLILHHDDCLGHRNTTDKHQEAVERIPAILDDLTNEKIFYSNELSIVNKFPKASINDIRRVHSNEYVDFVFQLAKTFEAQTPRSRRKPQAFTPKVQEYVGKVKHTKIKPDESCDTSFSDGSLSAALRAAGSVVYAIKKVIQNDCRNAFCAGKIV